MACIAVCRTHLGLKGIDNMVTKKELVLESLPEFDGHPHVSFLHNEKAGLRGYIAIHRRVGDNPSFGATRLWPYANSIDALRDALRLSRMMSYKTALAGLHYGGAKGVIIGNKISGKRREELLRSYAEEVNRLRGAFITGTDVGITQHDVALMRKESPYFAGIRANATKYTALGICYGLEVCLKELFGTETFHGRSFAIQGVGKIGSSLLRILYGKASTIYFSDTNRKTVAEIRKKFPRAKYVSPSAIHRRKVDVFCPCALSHSVNKKNVSEIKAVAVIGGANNQLESEEIGERLHRRGILYAPDYVVNAGGLISVVDEYEHKNIENNRILEEVKKIKERLQSIIDTSRKEGKSTLAVANRLAEEIVNNRNR